jgi:quercetin dioxygenase-like cupin family protein
MTAGAAPHTTIPNLLEQIEVPQNGTLSKTVYQDVQLKVVLFAFDTDQELSDHTASTPAIIQVLSGRLVLKLGDDETQVQAGAWVHMQANLRHAVRALEPSVMLLILLRQKVSP